MLILDFQARADALAQIVESYVLAPAGRGSLCLSFSFFCHLKRKRRARKTKNSLFVSREATSNKCGDVNRSPVDSYIPLTMDGEIAPSSPGTTLDNINVNVREEEAEAAAGTPKLSKIGSDVSSTTATPKSMWCAHDKVQSVTCT